MQDIQSIKRYVQDCVQYINADNVISDYECSKRAALFLEARYQMALAIQILSTEEIKLRSIKTAVYAKVFNRDLVSKNATEKKANAEANPEYIEAQEKLSEVEVEIAFFKSLSDIFKDAHVFYRQKIKETV